MEKNYIEITDPDYKLLEALGRQFLWWIGDSASCNECKQMVAVDGDWVGHKEGCAYVRINDIVEDYMKRK